MPLITHKASPWMLKAAGDPQGSPRGSGSPPGPRCLHTGFWARRSAKLPGEEFLKQPHFARGSSVRPGWRTALWDKY